MKLGKVKIGVLMVVGIGIVVLLVLFVSSSVVIGRSVSKQCKKAQSQYLGGCVVALAQVVDDDKNSLDERKQAIWALGQLGDGRALPVLEEYFDGSGAQCDHETKLCQYELEKAINLIKSGFNPTALIWRGRMSNF